MFKHVQLVAFALCALLVIPAAAQVPSYVPTDGLVGWWPFNGNANDESGNGNDGINNDVYYSTDRFDNASSSASFDSNGGNLDDNFSYVDVPEVSISGDYTLSFWILHEVVDFSYPMGFGINNQTIGFGYGIVCSGYTDEPYTATCNDPAQRYGNGDAEGQCYNGYYSNDTYELGVWEHITLSRQGNNVSFYINGSLDSSNDTLNINPINNLVFGRRSDGWFGFNGLLDDIAIYNRALTESEIQSLYTSQCPSVSTPCTSLPSNLQQGLVGYWPFCGNANDESGNGNDGVVNGATLTEDRFGNAGKAYSFNGTNNTIQIPTNTILEPSNELSVSIWLNPSGYGAGNFPHPIVKRLNPNSNTFGIVAGGGNSWACGIQTTNSGTAIYSEDDSFSIEQWILLTSTFDGNAHRLFVNGILTDSADVTGAIVYNSNYGWTLGYSTVFSQYFEGQLDDIGIWNRALTPEEVQELYTLDACTFTVYDTLTVYETVYDTVYTYETIYDTVTTYITVTDTLLIDITFVGFEGQPSWLNTVTVFPNPASDHITIDYGNFALMAGYNTIITNAAGATVYTSAVNSQQVEIDINAWGATGVYYMSVYDASGELVAVRHIVLE